MTIASHLLNNHKLTLNDYERDYLNAGSGGQGQDQGHGQGKSFIDTPEASNSLGKTINSPRNRYPFRYFKWK